MTMKEIYRDMEEEFKKNHPLLTGTRKKYKALQDISDEWRELRTPITITEATNRTEADNETPATETEAKND